ncbi:unnamed protein product, partial [marine sediment metagenome]
KLTTRINWPTGKPSNWVTILTRYYILIKRGESNAGRFWI